MGYVQKMLMKDEKILHFTKPHWIIGRKAVVWFIVTLLLLLAGQPLKLTNLMFGYPLYKVGAFITLIMSLFYGIPAYFHVMFSEIALTNRRFIIKTGFVETRSIEILLTKIESVQVSKPLLGKLLDYGSIVIHGVGGSKDIISFIPEPEKVRNMIQQQAETLATANPPK